jgi:hemin uptake protein HemP
MKMDLGQFSRAVAEVMDIGKDEDEARAEPDTAPLTEKLPQYDTETLFAGGREIVIRHAGATYRMKITRQGKLILNK